MPSIAPPAHTRRTTTTDDWITPKWLVDRLGLFDLDPCESDSQPWPCAKRGYRFKQNGLVQPWDGEVWLNPPYGQQTGSWLQRLKVHGNGMALVFARTETRMFFEHVWPCARSLLFLRGRLTFCYPDGSGSKAGHNSGGPSVLIAYGARSHVRLQEAADLGALVETVAL
jgi:hypothetical protein